MKLYLKSNYYGIRSRENDWFGPSLTNRKQYVLKKGFFLQTKIVRCGVPQGSTLEHLFFLIYISDFKNAHSLQSRVMNNELKLLTESSELTNSH